MRPRLRPCLLAVMLVLLSPAVSRGFPELPVKFQRLMLADGLSQSSILAVHQDSRGFIWFGTQDGLNRYDGRRIVAYKSDPDDPSSLSSSTVWCIAEDAEGDLWVGTEGGGFDHFHRQTGTFTQYRFDPEFPDQGRHYDVRAVVVDSTGAVWLGTHGDGLLHYEPGTGLLTAYTTDTASPWRLPDNNVTCLRLTAGRLWIGTEGGLVSTNAGRDGLVAMPARGTDLPGGAVRALAPSPGGGIWVGTETGLARLDGVTGAVIERPDLEAPRGPGALEVSALQEVPGGVLWVGTAHRGAYRFNRKTGTWRAYRNDPQDPTSLSDDEVYAITVDRTGVIWIGTSNGANRLDGRAKQFYHFFNKPGDPLSLSHDCVWGVCEDSRGLVWVVTESGINILDPDRNTMTQVFADPDDPRKPSYDSFIEVMEDSLGGIWLGARDGALNRYDPATGIYTRFEPDPNDSRAIADDRIFSIVCDSGGRVWIGTMTGLECYDPGSGTFTRYRHDPDDPQSIPAGSVRAMYMEPGDRLWMSFWGNGAGYLDLATGRFGHFTHDENRRDSLSSNVVLSITSDTRGRVWIGTVAGLALLDPGTGSCRRFSMEDGLPNNTIYRMEVDPAGNLWVATNFGLACFNPDSGDIRTYVDRDGIQNNEFNMGASHVGRSGRMYFGGIRGFNAFYPDSIRSNPIAPQVALTDFRIFNEPVPVGQLPDGRTVLDRTISEARHIELTAKDHVISFEFADLHFASPLKNNFAYIMEGFEDRWNEVGTRNHATYTNLPPGDYVFRVKGSNNDGVWNNKGVAVSIHVKPPFYLTAWFITGAVLFIVAVVYGLHRYRMRLLDVKNRHLEQRVNERTSDLTFANQALQQEINVRKQIEEELREARNRALAAARTKSEFLANMSHEIRTPMNGVLGMTSILLDSGLDEKQREYAEAVHDSASNLLVIINDILDFSKVEAGKLTLENIDFDLFSVLDRVTETLGCKAQEKGLHFACELEGGVPRRLVGDPVRLGQILVNLANNAVKFTQRGHVQVRVGCRGLSGGKADLVFTVRDTGAGIPADRVDTIFESFTQVDASVTRKFGGTGLGLAIVKQLTDLMGGEITVESREGEGTSFHVAIPLPVAADKDAWRPPVRALVVHPRAQGRETMRRVLAGLNCRARTVAPDTALGVFAKAAADGNPYQVVFLAHGVAGLHARQIATGIRNLGGEISTRIVLLCLHGRKPDDERVAAMGADSAVTVPPLYRRLEKLIRDLEPAPGEAAVETGEMDPEPDVAAEIPVTQEEGPLILLAEDNPINQKVATLLLEKLGYRVDVAANGLEALAAVAEKDYAAILMDVQMPEMDGLEAAARIRAEDSPARNPKVPMIALTAHARAEDRQRSLDAGMDDHLTKPIDSRALARVLSVYVRRENAPAPARV